MFTKIAGFALYGFMFFLSISCQNNSSMLNSQLTCLSNNDFCSIVLKKGASHDVLNLHEDSASPRFVFFEVKLSTSSDVIDVFIDAEKYRIECTDRILQIGFAGKYRRISLTEPGLKERMSVDYRLFLKW